MTTFYTFPEHSPGWAGAYTYYISARLLLDSRVVDVPMAYDPPLGMLSSLKT